MIASDSKGKVATYFEKVHRDAPLSDFLEGEPKIIFQSVYSSYDGVTTTTLTADGAVSTKRESGNPEEIVEEETIYTISLENVAAFESLLQQQQFAKFDRLSYADEDLLLVTEGSVTFISKDASVSFNAVNEYLPKNLRPIADAWLHLGR